MQLQELKEKIKEDAEKQFQTQADQQLLNAVTEYLVENTKFDLPSEFLKKWLAVAGEKPISAEQASEEYEKSEKGLRYQLIEGKVLKDNNIKLDFEELKDFAKGFVILIALAGSVFVGWKQVTKKTNEHDLFLGALLLLLGLCSLSTIVQHCLFETLYLLDRTAMFLVVLFNLTMVFFINELCKENRKSAIFSYVSCLFLVYHFAFWYIINNRFNIAFYYGNCLMYRNILFNSM